MPVATSMTWRCALLSALLLAANHCQAHLAGEGAIPESPGLRIGASAAAAWLDADDAVPAPRLTGVSGLGDTPEDQRGGRLEHATVDLGLRLHPRLGMALAIGWHDGEPAHVEAAWIELRRQADAELVLGAGRNRVPIGAPLRTAGHFDRFAHMPLVKRASFNGDWIEDGINVSWRPHLDAPWGWLQSIDVGLWRADRFPGSEDAPWAPVVHMGAAWSDIELDAFYSHIRPRRRGAYVQRAGSGHVHTAPRCDTSLRDITCMDGTVDLLGASLAWETPVPGLRVTGAALMRHERGDLYSQNGSTRYEGRSHGGWVEAVWQPGARWDLGVRQEWLTGTNRLAGPGAALVAADAGLSPNHPARRSAAMVGWRPVESLLLTFEIGQEQIDGRSNRYLGARLLWAPETLFERSW